MSTRGFTNQRITTILMFRTYGNLETHTLAPSRRPQSPGPQHAITLFNSRFGSACFGQGRRRAARHTLPLPYPHCGVDPWVKD